MRIFMTYQYHDESIIKSLDGNTIFVFGSNLAGTHAGGAAKIALNYFGAVKGSGRGWSGQSYAIPTMNEHLQQMPLSQIQHYIDDFKIYTRNHLNTTYFITSIGCGVAGYKVAEIAPMFKGISKNVIFPISFRPFVERTLPKLTQALLQHIFSPNLIFAESIESALNSTSMTDSEKKLASILIETPMFPVDSNGRERKFEIEDILYHLKDHTFNFDEQHNRNLVMGGVVLALLELYEINEQDFIDVWNGLRTLTAPKAENHSKK